MEKKENVNDALRARVLARLVEAATPRTPILIISIFSLFLASSHTK